MKVRHLKDVYALAAEGNPMATNIIIGWRIQRMERNNRYKPSRNVLVRSTRVGYDLLRRRGTA